jgi:hypothetical protein
VVSALRVSSSCSGKEEVIWLNCLAHRCNGSLLREGQAEL